MREFQYSSFCTEYKMTVNGYVKVRMGRHACFREAYYWLSKQRKKVSAEYVIILRRGCDWGKINNYKNACILERKELRYHLDQLKDAVPFQYKIKNVNKDSPCFELHVNVIEGTPLQHKYLLAWIRYAYEYPYNVMLFEARKLRWEKEFKFESGFNLFNIVSQCFDLWTGGHSIACENSVELLRKEALREKLQENVSPTARLCDIFRHKHVSGIEMVRRTSRIKKSLSVVDLEYWTNDQLFVEERLPVYKERLKYLRKK